MGGAGPDALVLVTWRDILTLSGSLPDRALSLR
jgi:hypothetical protein